HGFTANPWNTGARFNRSDQRAKMNESHGIYEQLAQRLAFDAMRRILRGASEVSRSDNPIRGNLFAAAMRELLACVMHKLAPDEEVKSCPWHKKETDDGRPTRAQRQRYVIQGGLSNEYVIRTFGLDTEELKAELRGAFEALHKATHVLCED